MQSLAQMNSPLFQPRTLSSLLELMRDILEPEMGSDHTNLERCNAPGKITLLHWGCVAPWSWTRWTDSRIAMFETVIKVVRLTLDLNTCRTLTPNQTSEWLLVYQDARPDDAVNVLDQISSPPLRLDVFTVAARANLISCFTAIYACILGLHVLPNTDVHFVQHQINYYTEKAKASLSNWELNSYQCSLCCFLEVLQQIAVASDHTVHLDSLCALVKQLMLSFVLLGGTALDTQGSILLRSHTSNIPDDRVYSHAAHTEMPFHGRSLHPSGSFASKPFALKSFWSQIGQRFVSLFLYLFTFRDLPNKLFLG